MATQQQVVIPAVSVPPISQSTISVVVVGSIAVVTLSFLIWAFSRK